MEGENTTGKKERMDKMECKNCEEGYIEIAHRNNPDTTECKMCHCCNGDYKECEECQREEEEG